MPTLWKSRRGAVIFVYMAALVITCTLPVRFSGQAQAAARLGMTLIVSPSAIPLNTPTMLAVRVIDSRGAPISGATVTIVGSTPAPAAARTTGSPLQLRVSASAAGGIQVVAAMNGLQSVATRVAVAAPRSPATVTALSPDMGIIARGVSLSRLARVHDPLFFQWRATTDATQRGSLTFADGSILNLDRDTTVLIKSPTRTFLQTGQVFLQVAQGGSAHDLETGNAVAASLGTRYAVQARNGIATFSVLSGRLNVRNAGKAVSLGPGEETRFGMTSRPATARSLSLSGPAGWAGTLAPPRNPARRATAYLLREKGHRLDLFSIETQHVYRSFALPHPAIGDSLSRDGTTLLLATTAGVLTMPAGGGSIRQGGPAVRTAALSPLPGSLVAVADVTDSAIQIVDTGTKSAVRTILLGYAPTGISTSPDGRSGVVTGKGHVSLVDLKAGTVLFTRLVAGLPGRPAYSADSSLGFVPLPAAGTLLELSSVANGQIGSVRLGPVKSIFPSSVAAPDGRVFVADSSGKTVDVVDPAHLQVLGRIRLPAHPLGIALAPDGKIAVVTSAPSLFMEIDPTDGFILGSVAFANLYTPLTIVAGQVLNQPNVQPIGSRTYSVSLASSVPPSAPIVPSPTTTVVTATAAATKGDLTTTPVAYTATVGVTVLPAATASQTATALYQPPTATALPNPIGNQYPTSAVVPSATPTRRPPT